MIPWVILKERMLRLGFDVTEVMRLQEDLHVLDLDVPDPFPDTQPSAPSPALYVRTPPPVFVDDDATPIPR